MKDNAQLIEELLKGNTNEVDFPIEGMSAPMVLRPLTSAQLVELQSIEKKGQKGTIKIQQNVKGRRQIKKEVEKQMQNIESEIDYGEMKKNIANTKAAAISMSARIDEDLVGQLPSAIVDDIFRKVIEISSITKEDLDLLADFQ